ncbi:phosphoribosyltransferase [Streptomyces sp. NPDC060188]|uniref:phosphoribosyltransferase n=1 Tax=Streptomyces sp. NPDC060188 TaxID=3347068 RepID=UPI0036479D47
MGNLLAAVGAAQTNINRLARPDDLRAAAEEISKVAQSSGAQALLAASPVAERLVGAVLLISDDLVNLNGFVGSNGFPGENKRVLIVDVNLASGTAVAQAARTARSAGAQYVQAAVLHQVTCITAGAAACGVDDLVVLTDAEHADDEPCGSTSSGLFW